jgi:AraC family transcriptional regulator
MGECVNYLPLEMEPRLMRIGGMNHAVKEDEMYEEYHMKDVWTLHFYTYKAELWVDGDLYYIKPYSISLVPPYSHVKFYFKTLNCYHISTFFKYTQEVEKKGIPFPCVMYLDEETFQYCYGQIHHAAKDYPLQIKKAQVAIWNILWKLTDSMEEGYHREWKDPLPLDRAIQFIERNYSSKIKIPQIADYAGVTPTHLSRLFNKRFDTTVIAYVRRKRVSEAVYYLTHTNLPIKEVAYRVGVEDLSHFYKIVHKELNSTPHEIRLKALEGNSFA